MDIRLTLRLLLPALSVGAETAETKRAEAVVETSALSVASGAVARTVAAARSVTAARSVSGLSVLKSVIRLLDFLELLLGLCFIRIIDVRVRMILPAQCPVCLLDLII